MYVSFADELKNKNNPQKNEYGDGLYVSCIIGAIKKWCKLSNSHGEQGIKGYLWKKLDTEYFADYSCDIVKSIQSKREQSSYARQTIGVNTVYYPYDPNANWDGPLFDLKDSTIEMIKSAFDELGFTNSNIIFNKVEVEKGTKKGLMNVVKYTKTGDTGYLVYVEINW